MKKKLVILALEGFYVPFIYSGCLCWSVVERWNWLVVSKR